MKRRGTNSAPASLVKSFPLVNQTYTKEAMASVLFAVKKLEPNGISFVLERCCKFLSARPPPRHSERRGSVA